MPRVLIVEDNRTNLDLMAYLVRAGGCTVLSAEDGLAGLELARRERPDVIVCDIQLPKMDGFALARALKQDPAWRGIPLIAVTAMAMVGDRERALAAGFDRYLSKPIEPEAFLATIAAFLPGEGRRAPVAPPPAPEPSPAPPTAPQASARGTVLAIDDVKMNLDLIRNTLSPLGYRVMGVASLDELLRLARVERADLIICDLHMPGNDGFEVLRVFKSDPALRDVPFMFLSATVSHAADRARALALGADRLVRRPIEPEQLVIEVEHCIAQGGRRA